MNRSRGLQVATGATLALLLACGATEERTTPAMEDAVLAAVVDSVPFLIRYTFGDGEAREYTAVLSAESLEPPADSLGGLALGEDPETRSALHPLGWLHLQSGKPHVVGLCRTRERPGPCRAGGATMAVFLSRPAFSDASVARVHVRLLRQVGDLPTPWGAVGPFRAELTLRMEALADGRWGVQYVDLEQVGI